MDELHQIGCPLPLILTHLLPSLLPVLHVFLQDPNVNPRSNTPCHKHKVGGHVGHGTISRGNSREHLASAVDDGALYLTPAEVHPLSLFNCPRAEENDRYHDEEQSPASSFRLATWKPSTSGGGTSLRSATTVTLSGGTPSELSNILKCLEEPVSPCSSAHRTLLIMTRRCQQRSCPPQLNEDGGL